ncbi:hypothetical protein EFV12PHI1_RNA13 [Enterococcus phage EfV12-phi1]|uniref:Uncharacterized protein n=1 Tax=Enterococcus phage EfV12-phi1 TaxID=2315766 RepID=A0A3B8DK13_9CAUD|nr:hypothetical protein HOU42_gp099 [Enterococcus phage EfV12-phi1]AYJ73544.1 hypothetical protein EFV12PHI1_RNA13 [Enterococcus phage EfV12-phi1]
MKPFEDIFDVLNKARQDNDKVTLTFIEGLDNIARLQIEDSSATAGTTRYVKFYNNDIRKFQYVDQADFEEMYAGLEMKTGKPKEEAIEFPSEEVGIISALKILQQSGVFSDEDGMRTLGINTSTLKDAHYILQYIEPAIDRYFESLNKDIEELDRVMINQSDELKQKIWESFVFSKDNLSKMLDDFELATLDTFPNVPSNLIVDTCSEVKKTLEGLLIEDAEENPIECHDYLVRGFVGAVIHIEQFIISVATLSYRRTELELRESREAYIKELASNLFIFAEAIAQAYTRLVCSILMENSIDMHNASEYIQVMETKAVHWVKEEALGGTMLANNEEDLVELSQALNSMTLDDVRETQEDPEKAEFKEALEELLNELIGVFSEDEDEEEVDETEDEDDEEIKQALLESLEAFEDLLRSIQAPTMEEEEEDNEVPFETPMVDMDDLLGYLLSGEPKEKEEPVELSDDAKAEFEEYFADEIGELQELREKGKDAVALYNKINGELPLTEIKSMAMKNMGFALSTLQKMLDGTELDYTKRGLLDSLDRLKGSKYNLFVEYIEFLREAHKLYKTVGIGIVAYAHAIVEDIENTVDNVMDIDYETAYLVKLAVKQINQDIKAFEENDGYSDLLAFSLAFTLVVIMRDYGETDLSPISVEVEDFVSNKKPSVVVEDEEEEEEKEGAIDLAKELKDLIRGTALDTDNSLNNSVDEEALITDYKNGVSQRELTKCYNISTGKFYSILRRHGIAVDSSKVAKKVAHVEENPEVLEQVLRDYIEGKTLAYIYSNYNLYKNGLFYLLDKYQIPRRNKR